jgi:diguanylate cyclase (GGDEF)-like protein
MDGVDIKMKGKRDVMVNPQEIFAAKILIVDDQLPNVVLLEQLLLGAGYVALQSTIRSDTVCALHRQHGFDLIILDLEMPGMNGFQVMDGLQELNRNSYLPVLVITADQAQLLPALKRGAKDFISKPFQLDEVLIRIHNFLEVRLLYKKIVVYNNALESMAHEDALTGLPNRRQIVARMQLALAHARRNATTMAVVYLDLDGFKQINDTWGHGAGDNLLRQVAVRLVGSVREVDTVARLGGDEFMLLLWRVSGGDDAHCVTQKVIKALAQPYQIEGRTIKITASAGISLFSSQSDDVETLMKKADKALYQAKSAGKNQARLAN